MSSLSYSAQVDALEKQGRRFLDVVATGMERPVPSCPGWDVEELVAHVSHIYGWAGRNLAAGAGERVRMGRSATDGPEQCAAALAHLVRALRGLDPETACAGPLQPRTARWWARRQLLETVVHRWDVENALGTPTEIDDAVAAIGVAEFLEVFAGGSPLPVRIRATNAEVLLLLWGRLDLDAVPIHGSPDAYLSWRSAIAT